MLWQQCLLTPDVGCVRCDIGAENLLLRNAITRECLSRWWQGEWFEKARERTSSTVGGMPCSRLSSHARPVPRPAIFFLPPPCPACIVPVLFSYNTGLSRWGEHHRMAEVTAVMGTHRQRESATRRFRQPSWTTKLGGAMLATANGRTRECPSMNAQV